MYMRKKEKHAVYLALSISRVVFLFGDYFLSNNNLNIITPIANKQTDIKQQTKIVPQAKSNEISTSDLTLPSMPLQNIGLQKEQVDEVKLEDFEENDSNNFDNIQALKNIYNKTQNKNVLNVLLDKLVQNYQFNDAKSYILSINDGNYSKNIDSNIYLHILVNSLSPTNPNDIIEFESVLNQIYSEGFIKKDDAYFYMGLVKIYNKDRDGASKIFKTIPDSRYSKFIQSYFDSLNNPYIQSDISSYYKDGLVALTMLKNGYFSIAKKIALSIAIKDEAYILPYQILAYSHFLTNDRETAIDYFFKLIDINPVKEDNYKFLIGISYYRNEKYEQSVLYLSQIKGEIYKIDVYRYLILNYIAGNDSTKLVRMRQSILGQDNLQKSDFYTFFYNVFFLPFRNQEIFTIYNDNPELTTSFLDKCYQTFGSGDDDICIYGQAGQDIASSNRIGAKDKLLYISQHYKQGYIYHALGDYYNSQKDVEQAKEYYLKAVSMTTSEIEKTIIRKKLME
ncbi:MAG: hypothetical protein WAZ12_05345 [Candidatus Absconditicoccaceae bacterium]